MKKILFLLNIFLLMTSFSCSITAENNEFIERKTMKDFLELFEAINFKSLHVFSPYEIVCKNDLYSNNIEKDSKFYGTEIPKKYYKYFDEHFNSLNCTIYACYKFYISNEKIGLILRGPNKYLSPKDIYLWIYNFKTNKLEKNWEYINYMLANKQYYPGYKTANDENEKWNFRTYGIRIAEFWSDEGVVNIVNSWILDIDNDNILDLVQRYRHDKWKKTDNSYDKHAKDEFTFYLNLNNGFVSTKNIQIENKESFEILFFKQ